MGEVDAYFKVEEGGGKGGGEGVGKLGAERKAGEGGEGKEDGGEGVVKMGTFVKGEGEEGGR